MKHLRLYHTITQRLSQPVEHARNLEAVAVHHPLLLMECVFRGWWGSVSGKRLVLTDVGLHSYIHMSSPNINDPVDHVSLVALRVVFCYIILIYSPSGSNFRKGNYLWPWTLFRMFACWECLVMHSTWLTVVTLWFTITLGQAGPYSRERSCFSSWKLNGWKSVWVGTKITKHNCKKHNKNAAVYTSFYYASQRFL